MSSACDIARREPLAAVQEGELDQEAAAHDLAAELLDELAQRRAPCRRWRAGRRARARACRAATRVGVQLELAGAVLEHVLGADRLVRAACRACARARSRRRARAPARARAGSRAPRPRPRSRPSAARAYSASPRTASASASASAISGVMSLKAIPGLGKSGISRISAAQLVALPRSAPGAHQRTILRRSRISSRCLRWVATAARFSSASTASLRRSRVARAQRRREDLLQQVGLAVGGGAEHAQVAPADAVARELGDGGDDLALGLVEVAHAAAQLALDDAVLFELAHELRLGLGLLEHVLERVQRAGRPRAHAHARAPRRARRRARAPGAGGGARRSAPRRAPGGSRAAAGTRRAACAGSCAGAPRRPGCRAGSRRACAAA